jgi:hypothetical protein
VNLRGDNTGTGIGTVTFGGPVQVESRRFPTELLANVSTTHEYLKMGGRKILIFR